MEEVQHRVHLAGTDLLGRTSSPSSAAVKLACTHHRPPPPPPLLSHHLQEPADSSQLEEFNSAIRRSCAGEGNEKARMSSLVMPAAPEVSGGVPGARSANAVRYGQELADSARLGEFNFVHTIDSDRMASALRYARVLSAPEREEVASGRVPAASPVNASPEKARDGATNQHEVALAPEGTDARAGEEAAPASPRSLNVAILSPSRPPTAPPVDVVAGEDDQAVKTHLQVPALASGKACDGDQETGLDFSRDPAAEPCASSPSTSSDTDGGDDLYDLGVVAAMEMDTETLRSEVAKYFRREANGEQRPQRRAATQRNPTPPVKFSLRLSDEEAMADVAAVSPARDVRLEAELPPLCRNAKRRRR